MTDRAPQAAFETTARADLEKIYRAGVAAVDPARLIAQALTGSIPNSEQVPQLIANSPRVWLLAVGKASAAMALELEHRVGAKLAGAIAVVPGGIEQIAARGSKIRFVASAHPVPDPRCEAAADAGIELLDNARADDLVIVAISGGASAMFTKQATGVTLADKIAINQALLRAGASVRELNVVRKHLSALKGGRMLRRCGGARVLGLALSDVSGNDLATIGSGLTSADWSTFGDAVSVLKRRDVWGKAPEAIRIFLERAAAGEFDETVKTGDPVLERVTNIVIGDNSTALAGAEAAAAALGYSTTRLKEMRGEANDAGRAMTQAMSELSQHRACAIAGGEPVVTVRGSGKGGRAQQAALAMAIELGETSSDHKVIGLFAGTDGVDGPTDAAGGFASPTTVARGEKGGLSASVALARNDAYNFLKAAGDLFVTGPTGTNVSDIFIGLVNP